MFPMTVKLTPLSPPAIPHLEWSSLAGRGKAPRTLEECQEHIGALGQRIAGYVQFMSKAGDLGGTSAESKDKSVAAFCDRMVAAERQLRRIYEELRLG
jgi:hypothetical protein